MAESVWSYSAQVAYRYVTAQAGQARVTDPSGDEV